MLAYDDMNEEAQIWNGRKASPPQMEIFKKKKNIDFIERKKNNNNILKLFDHPDYSVRIMQVRQSGCPSFWR